MLKGKEREQWWFDLTSRNPGAGDSKSLSETQKIPRSTDQMSRGAAAFLLPFPSTRHGNVSWCCFHFKDSQTNSSRPLFMTAIQNTHKWGASSFLSRHFYRAMATQPGIRTSQKRAQWSSLKCFPRRDSHRHESLAYMIISRDKQKCLSLFKH